MAKEQAGRRTSITILPEDEAVVQSVAKDYGLSTSGSVRFIIRDWARMKAEAAGVELLQQKSDE